MVPPSLQPVLLAALTFSAALGLPGTAPSQDYVVVDLGALGFDVSRAHDINQTGQISGDTLNANGEWRAFLWTAGTMVEIPPLTGHGSDYGYGFGLNATGTVVGESGFSDAFLWDGGATIPLGNFGGGGSSFAYAVNDAGQVVGQSGDVNGYSHAFLWENGVMTDLGTLTGTWWGWSEAHDINQVGDIVGLSDTRSGDQKAFLWSQGVMTDIGGLGGGYSIAYAINDLGQIAGMSYTPWPSYSHATLWTGGSVIDLGTLEDPEPGGSYALDLNNVGQVVGWSSYPGSTVGRHAFLFENGLMKDLNDLIDPGSGWVLEEAKAINDRGQIVGYGQYQGHTRGFLLEPSGGTRLVLADPVPGAAGTINTFTVTEATPGALIYFTYGLQPGSSNVPGCVGLFVSIASAVAVPPVVADPAGQAGLDFLVPPAASGRTVLLQVVEPSSCSISNLVSFPFP